MTFKEELENMNACDPAIEWVGSRTEAQAWTECPRADWMLWLAAKRIGTWGKHKQIVLAACLCGETSLKYARKEDLPLIKAAYAAARTCAESPTEENKKAAYAAAYAAVRTCAENSTEENKKAAVVAVAVAAVAAASAAAASTYAYAAAAYAAADAAYAYAALTNSLWAKRLSKIKALQEMADLIRPLFIV